MTHPSPLCFKCDRYQGQGKCEAFSRIPEQIIFYQYDHRLPFKGDNGLQFKPIKKRNSSST